MHFLLTVLCCILLFPFDANANFITFKSANAPEKFTLHELPKPPPAAAFFDEKGNETHFNDFAGKIVLVNVWSKACAQCIVELPMLDALQKSFGTMKFKVVTLSVGKESAGQLSHFFAQKKLKNLRPYLDSKSQAALAAGVIGLPTTLLLNEKGEEIGRIRGIAEWTSPAIKAQIRELIRDLKEKEEENRRQKEYEKDSAFVQNQPPLKRETVLQWFKK